MSHKRGAPYIFIYIYEGRKEREKKASMVFNAFFFTPKNGEKSFFFCLFSNFYMYMRSVVDSFLRLEPHRRVFKEGRKKRPMYGKSLILGWPSLGILMASSKQQQWSRLREQEILKKIK